MGKDCFDRIDGKGVTEKDCGEKIDGKGLMRMD